MAGRHYGMSAILTSNCEWVHFKIGTNFCLMRATRQINCLNDQPSDSQTMGWISGMSETWNRRRITVSTGVVSSQLIRAVWALKVLAVQKGRFKRELYSQGSKHGRSELHKASKIFHFQRYASEWPLLSPQFHNAITMFFMEKFNKNCFLQISHFKLYPQFTSIMQRTMTEIPVVRKLSPNHLFILGKQPCKPRAYIFRWAATNNGMQ